MPVILMPRVEDVPEVGDDVRSNQGPTIQHFRNVFQALGDLHTVNRRIDGREGAEDLLRGDADLEGRISLRIKRLGRGHSTSQPEENERVGGGLGLFERLDTVDQPRLARRQGGQSRRVHRTNEVAAGPGRTGQRIACHHVASLPHRIS